MKHNNQNNQHNNNQQGGSYWNSNNPKQAQGSKHAHKPNEGASKPKSTDSCCGNKGCSCK